MAQQGTDSGTALRSLTLVKGEHVYVFRYSEGQEPAVIESLASLAERKGLGFDWFDAAFLSYQLGRRLEKDLHLRG